MKKYFLDCGTNLGQGLLQFISNGIVDDTFEIHMFEPNPHAIEFTKKRLADPKYDRYTFVYHQVAVWKEQCKKNLTIEAFDGEYYCQHTGELLGHDLKSGGATNIMGEEWSKPHYIPDNTLNRELLVDCIDFASFVSNLSNDSSYIICKMDIEGAEYEVLTKLLETNAISRINEIYVEWHAHMLKKGYDTGSYIQKIRQKGVKIESWI